MERTCGATPVQGEAVSSPVVAAWAEAEELVTLLYS
jgi:hypothetical protein